MKDRGSMWKFGNARSTFRNLHVDPLSFMTLSETNKYNQSLYLYIYTLSKLSHFRNEISVLKSTTGQYSEQLLESPARMSRQPLHWRMVVKIFLMFIVAENTGSVNITSYLSTVVQILTDEGHVICSFKQLFSVKLPSLVAPWSLYFGPHIKVLLFPCFQHSLGFCCFGFHFFCTLTE